MPQNRSFLSETERQLIARMLQAYGLPFSHIAPAQKGYRNASYRVQSGSKSLNVIVYKKEPAILQRITNANWLGAYVARAGLPARQLFDPRIIKLQAGQHTKYAAIYHYLPGATIPWEAYTRDHIKQLGKTLSDLHAYCACIESHLPDVTTELLALNQRMHRYFADPHVRAALRQKLAITTAPPDFTAILQASQSLPNQHALHMDFVRGNILFTGTQVSGILDFEKAAHGHAVFDIARALAFLLVDCKYKPPRKVFKYFVVSGYNKRGGAEFTAWHMLAPLVSFFLFHDFYKFLRHNPYESLHQNEHFVRTQTMLLKRGLITPAK